MNKLMGAVLVVGSMSGCMLDDDGKVITDMTSNSTPQPTAAATPTPSATASPTAAATPAASASPTATPSGPVVSSSPTAAPTSTPAPSSAPTPSPSATPSSTDDKSCFNPELLTPGSSYSWTLKRDDGSVTGTDDRSVSTGTFNAQAAIKTVADMTTSNGSPSTTDTYQNMDEGAWRIDVLGTETTSPAAVTITFTPAYELRFNLQPGESYTQNYQQDIDTYGYRIAQQVSRTRTFLDMKSITVPAGAFQTCHFREQTSIDGAAPESVETWIDSASGLLVQQLNPDGSRDQLTQGEVNGDPVP